MIENTATPLLVGKGLPNFKEITPNAIERDIPKLLKQLNKDFLSLEIDLSEKLTQRKSLSWDEVINTLYLIEEKLRWSWGIVCHLNGVSNSSKLREKN